MVNPDVYALKRSSRVELFCFAVSLQLYICVRHDSCRSYMSRLMSFLRKGSTDTIGVWALNNIKITSVINELGLASSNYVSLAFLDNSKLLALWCYKCGTLVVLLTLVGTKFVTRVVLFDRQLQFLLNWCCVSRQLCCQIVEMSALRYTLGTPRQCAALHVCRI
jgi:hypothetical protein